jgi:hypothetical protein
MRASLAAGDSVAELAIGVIAMIAVTIRVLVFMDGQLGSLGAL